MDRLLRPKTLETEPTDANAEKVFRHWKTTFENFLESTITAVPAGTPGDDASLAAEQTAIAANNRKKFHGLINCISPDIFEMIEGDTYDTAIESLTRLYVRPTSVVYNRHQLITCKQDAGQSVDTYLQNLQRLAKPCDFKAVTAEQNKNQYIRDAFINGITSAHIRQRLLENIGELTLEQASTQARALEQAQCQNQSYESNVMAALEVPDSFEETLGAAPTPTRPRNWNKKNNKIKNNNNGNSGTCSYCGNQPHPRPSCPAKDDICDGCGKKGHWIRVCFTTNRNTLGTIGTPLNNAMPQQQQQQLQHQFQQQPQQQHSQHPFQQRQQQLQHQSQQQQHQIQYQQHQQQHNQHYHSPTLA